MSAHTPGPWFWLNDDTLVGEHGRRPVVLAGDDLAARHPVHGSLVGFDKNSPDARLIASAPDMLAALREVDRYLEDVAPLLDGNEPTGGVRTTIANIRAAIAKATE